ncbi:MAG TPA: DnaJ C-terminal domain-containing protein [bacterium]|nr:DnaJ C-terminal domain-containing protein [bacterium]
MEFKDYYKVLGVERAADSKQISRAFRRLAREHHPDVNKAKGAEERFKEINEAYQVLGDPAKRARYDQMHEAYQRGGVDWQQIFRGAGQTPPGGFTVVGDIGDLEEMLGGLGGFSDFFRQFFGGAAAPGQPGRGRARRGRGGRMSVEELMGQAAPASAEASLEVTLEEVFHGAQKPVTLQVNGTSRRLDITIPKGVRSGQRIRLPGALDGGDLYLTVQVLPHPRFARQGDDVTVEVRVPLADAMLGAEIQVPTLEGGVSMTIPPESQNGRTFRLRGLGMPRPDGTRGDQLVRIKVILPAKLTSDERKFFQEMRNRRRDHTDSEAP